MEPFGVYGSYLACVELRPVRSAIHAIMPLQLEQNPKP